MRDSGYYALLHANGMSWATVVELIRAETLEWKATQDADRLQARANGESD